MDYEKKYNEALAWMRELYPGLHGATKEDAEHYFPELRESEDEIARKWLTYLVENLGDPADEEAEKELEVMRPLALAYLEKQKEQKPADLSKMMVHKEPYVAPVPTPMVPDEPKPTEWSEEDEDRIRQIERIAQQAGCTQKLQEEIHDWLKSLRPNKQD